MSFSGEQRLIEFDSFDGVPAYLVDMMTYWESSCRGNAIPHVSAIDPTTLPKHALRWIAIFDVLSETNDYKVRLAGTGISALTGREFTGMLVSRIPGAERGMERMRRCVAERRPYYSGDPLRWSLGQEHIDYSVLCLPFRGDADEIARLVMVFQFHLD